MVSLDALWNELKATYQKDLSPASYNTWIETANPRTLDQNQLVVEVPSKIHKEYWEKTWRQKSLKSVICYQEMRLSSLYYWRRSRARRSYRRKKSKSCGT